MDEVVKELSDINSRLGLNERWALLEDVVDLLTEIRDKLDLAEVIDKLNDIDGRLSSLETDIASIRSDVSSIEIKTD